MTTLVAVLGLIVGIAVPATAAAAVPAPAAATAVTPGAVPTAPASVGPVGGPAKMSLSGFNPGNIISDAVFTDRTTMTEAQIQSFLNSKVTTCQAGYTCLKNFRLSTPSRGADKYCNGYRGEANESAARILYKVAQSCGINPQVLVVMLQKEQGLVTHPYPTTGRYGIAMGFNCPDTAPCDAGSAGFFTQVYGAARQMQIYMEGRYFQWYKAGQTWQIQYHPDRARCGTSPVYIANKATEALYYYTPYQPNAAAMRAGYGTGDSCSAYGNRNFYNYFTDWFGSTQSVSAQILRDSETRVTYLVSQGRKYRFPTSERAVQFTWLAPVQAATSTQLSKFADAGDAPRAVRTDAGNVYLLDSGRRIGVPGCARAGDYGWDCASLPVVGQGQVAIYGDGGTLEPSIAALGTSWLVQSASRREILDRSLLLQFGMSSGATAVSDAMASEYKVGDPVLGAGVYVDGAGRMRAMLGNGSVYDVPAEGRLQAMTVAARRLTLETWALLKSAGSLPVAVTAGGRTHLMTDAGWLHVDAYGPSVAFTDLRASSLAGMPSAGSVLGPHFVRERSSVQVFLVSGGTMQPANAEQQRWITATFGVPAQVRVVADTALGSRVPAGQRLVRTSDGAAYIIDGTDRHRFWDCAQVADWGTDCSRLSTVSIADIAPYTDRGWLQRVVRQPDGTMWLIQSGKRREVIDTSVLAPYGIGGASSSVSSTLVRTLAVGSPVLASGVYTNGVGSFVLANPAGNHQITARTQVTAVKQSARRLTQDSLALLPITGDLKGRMLSDGRAFLLADQGWLQVDPALYGGAKAFPAAGAGAWSGLPIAHTESRPHFVRDRGADQTFLVSGGVLQPVESDDARIWLSAYFGLPSRLWTLADGALSGLTLAPGLIARTASSTYFVTDGVTEYRLADCAAVASFGKTCTGLPTVRTDALDLKDGGTLTALLQAPSGEKWLVQSGKRREVPDPSILAAYGIGSAASPVSAAILQILPVGEPVVAAGPYRSPTGAMRITTDGGPVLEVPTAAQVEALKGAAKPLTSQSFNFLKPSGNLPVRAVSAGVSYMLSAQGWARVDAANYGALTFSPVVAGVISAVPAGPVATGARFVREASTTQTYLASGGLTPMTAEQMAWATAVYGVPSTVVVVADGALR